MGSYSFKSVGRTENTVVSETQASTPLAIGIKTPLRYGKDSLFEVNTVLADQVADNFRNMLQTNKGERLGGFELGADLRPLLSNFATLDDFDTEAMRRISDAASRWMPYIELEDFISSTDRTQNQNLVPVTMRITYGIPALNVKKRIIELTMYAM